MATAILQEVAALTDGELQLEPGTLYRALHRMLKDGWVAESARRPAADLDDERRRYYRLTPARPARRDGRGRAPVAPGHRRARPQVAVPCLTCPAEAATARRRTREAADLPRRVAWWLVWAYPPRVPPRRRPRAGRRARRSDARAPRRRRIERRRPAARAIADTLRNAPAEWIDDSRRAVRLEPDALDGDRRRDIYVRLADEDEP